MRKFFMLLLCLNIQSCSGNKDYIEVFSLTDKLGVYSLEGGPSIVMEEKDGFLNVWVEDDSISKRIEFEIKPSIYQRWSIGWQGRYLLFYSSDIGTFFWDSKDSAMFVEEFPYDRRLETTIFEQFETWNSNQRSH